MQVAALDDAIAVTDISAQADNSALWTQTVTYGITLQAMLTEISGTLNSETSTQSMAALVKGAGDLASGTQSALNGAKELNSGVGELKSGIDSLDSGAGELSSGAEGLKDGATTLKSGTSELKDGTGQLVVGTNTLNDGAAELKEGIATLKDGVVTLDDGVGTLDEGASKNSCPSNPVPAPYSQPGATNTGASLIVSISAPNTVAIAPVRDLSPFPQNPV